MHIIQLDWANFKVDIIDKGFPINYKTIMIGYEVFAVDRGLLLWTSVITSASDISDFETNYKANSNRNTEYDSDGKSIAAPKHSEAIVFNAEAIRDTAVHNSNNAFNLGYRVKTIIMDNQLNQLINCQCQGSRDGVNWFNVCSSCSVSATTLTYESCETYFPYFRIQAQCSTAPTTGALSIWFERIGL